jgi:CheY-like chemotaxis protein
MSYPILRDKSVLIVEDDPSMAHRLAENLRELVGCNIVYARSVEGALIAIDSSENDFDLALIDMYIPRDDNQPTDRTMRGDELASSIRKKSKLTKIVGISQNLERAPFTPISDLFSGFIYKGDIPYDKPPIILFETLESVLISKKGPRIFIVHGYDNSLLFELKDYLIGVLGYDEIIVLREQVLCGKTIIEGFEQYIKQVDIVFVLITPDDEMAGEYNQRRSRQNVVFELGFFFGKYQRANGKVVLLCNHDLEIPSDISGINYIDISNGIHNSVENIREAISNLGWRVGV